MTRRPFEAREAAAALWHAKWEVLLPVLVIGGIFGGFTTLLEAAALSVVYVLAVQTVIRRDLHPNLLEADTPSARCEPRDVEFSLPLTRPASRGRSDDVASVLGPIRCGDGIHIRLPLRGRDFVAFHRYFARYHELCHAEFEGHQGPPAPDSHRATFVGTAPVRMGEPVVERVELDLRCAAKFRGGRSCAVCDVVRDDRLAPEVLAADAPTILVRADVGRSPRVPNDWNDPPAGHLPWVCGWR